MTTRAKMYPIKRKRSATFKLAIVGTVAAAFLLLAMLVSNQRTFGYIGTKFGFLFSFSSLLVGPPNLHRGSTGWVFYDAFGNSAISWHPRYIFRYGLLNSMALWKPLVLIVVPTAAFWLMDRFRFRIGRCQKCGYNLKGNMTGICSECGTPT